MLPGIGDKMGKILLFLFREAGKPVAVKLSGTEKVTKVELLEQKDEDSVSEAVKKLVGMGFPEEKVKPCLRAALNDLNRAVEYLMSGVPKNLQAQAANTDLSGD
jgi:Holliday junction resolvasome RuvABC DNA-binding subunit